MKLLTYPHPYLDRKLPELAQYGRFDAGAIASDALYRISNEMLQTMQESSGVGLAANQVGTSFRIYVSDCPGDQVRMYVNPEILELVGDKEPMDEGCLSFPGIKERVLRAPEVRLRAITCCDDYVAGKYTEVTLTGLAAQVAQHEIEHLNGDHFGAGLGPVARDQMKRRVHKGWLRQQSARR